MRVRRTIAIAVLLLASCKTPATKAERAHEELASWAATGQMMSDQWARGRAPTPYVKSTVDVALDEVQQLADPLKNHGESTRDISEVTALYRQLSGAVERSDRQSAGAIARRFNGIATRLKKTS